MKTVQEDQNVVLNSVLSESEAEQSFKVRFCSGYKAVPPNSFLLHGNGLFYVNRDNVRISGKRYRSFSWFDKPKEHVFPRGEIYNVVADGKNVRFDLCAGNGEPTRQVGFVASNKQTAEMIVAALPQQMTEAVAKIHAERSDFQSRLNAVSPNAPVTPIIVALNVLVFVLMAIGGAGVWVPNAEVVAQWGSNYGPLTMSGQWWRLFTSTFIHFGILHLSFNMLALYQSGRMVERMFGSLRFLFLYVFAGLTGSVVSLLWNPMVNSAGASGAIFGVFGGLLAFVLNRQNAVPPSIVKAHRNSTLAFIVYNLANGFSHTGIDNGAHIGGLLGGMVIGFLLARPIEKDARIKPDNKGFSKSILASLIALAIISYPLYNPSENTKQELAFNQALNFFAKQEQKVVDDSRNLFKSANQIPPAELSAALERDIAPQWDSLYTSIASAQLSEQSKRYPFRQALLLYLDDNRKANHLIADGIRRNDKDLIDHAINLRKDANLQSEKMKKLMPH